MILRIDRLQLELPPPSDPDPAGAAAVQELLGGRFGEMSTFMNYTFQSFNFRGRQGARPFFDLVANIAARGVRPRRARRDDRSTRCSRALRRPTTAARRAARSPRSRGSATRTTSSPAAKARCHRTRTGRPWTGDYVFSSGDLVEDLTHNFFLETGARNNKLKVYEMVEHPAARALTGYLLVRGGVHQVAYARAIGAADRRGSDEAVPDAAHPDGEDPRVPSRTSSAASTCGSTASPPTTTASWPPSSPGRTRRPARRSKSWTTRPRALRHTTCRRSPPCSRPTTRRRRSRRSPTKLRKDAGLPKEPSGLVADLKERTRSASRKTSTSRSTSTTNRRSTARSKK